MSVPALLNKTCSIVRRTVQKSTVTGETYFTYSTFATSVPCAVQVRKPSEKFVPTSAARTEFDVYFTFGTDIRNDDRLSSVTGFTDQTFAVRSEGIDDSGRGAYTRVIAEHTEGEAGV